VAEKSCHKPDVDMVKGKATPAPLFLQATVMGISSKSVPSVSKRQRMESAMDDSDSEDRGRKAEHSKDLFPHWPSTTSKKARRDSASTM
jgi:hypothetical protein